MVDSNCSLLSVTKEWSHNYINSDLMDGKTELLNYDSEITILKATVAKCLEPSLTTLLKWSVGGLCDKLWFMIVDLYDLEVIFLQAHQTNFLFSETTVRCYTVWRPRDFVSKGILSQISVRWRENKICYIFSNEKIISDWVKRLK